MMELWPFTNFHDLNLDWIIKVIKELRTTVNTWTGRLHDLLDEGGIYEVLYNLINEHPEWASELPFVTPELYGYESGDVSTYLQQAIDNAAGKWVLLLDKNYELADTINLTNGSKIKGLKNSRLSWTGIVNGTMITSTAVHSNRARIDHVYFTLNNAKTAIESNANTWGGCIKVSNCRFEGGTDAVIDLKTNYNTSFTDCEFFTDGFIKMRPYDTDMPDADTLSNCNTFERCYYSGTSNRTTKAFSMVNTYNTTFIDCAIERTALAFEQDRTHTTRTYGCWFENVNALYDSENISYDNSNHYVNVLAFNKNHQNIDLWKDDGSTQYLRYSGNNTQPYRYVAVADNEYVDRVITVNNQAANTYDVMYKLGTKEFNTWMPHNMRRVHASETNSISMELDAFFKDGNIGALYEITAFVYYTDASTHMARWTILQRESNTYLKSDEQTLQKAGWGTANNNTLSTTMATDGRFTVTTSTDNFRFAYLIVKTEPLGNRMNADNT